MNVLLGIFIAAAIIAVLMTVRVVVDRRALAERLKSDRDCNSHQCIRGCGPDTAGSASECAPPGANDLTRSTPHAS